MLRLLMTIVSLLTICIGIGVEYYDDKIPPEIQTEDLSHVTPCTRQKDNKDVSDISNIWEQNVTDFFNSSITPKYNSRRYNNYYTTISDRNYKTTLLNLTVISNFTLLANTNMKKNPLETLKEYEYSYDDESSENVLRYNIQTPEPKLQLNVSTPNVKSPLIEFYNLDPAIEELNLNVQHTHSNCLSMWYVLEDLPCWELPLLYGRFGSQKKASEVFLMHGGELKNVVENDDAEKWQVTQGKANVPLHYYTSKWCKTAPCYGDHTLCLFSDKYKSDLCDDEYTVDTLNVSEQIALLNTLNSMRNKIANGESDRYSHLPTAANMNQIIYDFDLENFAKAWLLQCLPGPEPCSALDGTFVNQLECTKFAKFCCIKHVSSKYEKCTPKPECYTSPVIGCLDVWFWNAGSYLTVTDIQCAHASALTYSTAQILWATTFKIGCAYGTNKNGNVRVICNFSPGAPYALNARYYCGIINLKGGDKVPSTINISNTTYLKSFGIDIHDLIQRNKTKEKKEIKYHALELGQNEDVDTSSLWGIEVFQKIYVEGLIRKKLRDFKNGTKDMIARLVLKYKFIELSGAKCDSDVPIYIIGPPGSLCVERGRRYQSLCYNFRDPTPGYRLVAIVAPISLFSLILYDLFSGIVRQTNY